MIPTYLAQKSRENWVLNAGCLAYFCVGLSYSFGRFLGDPERIAAVPRVCTENLNPDVVVMKSAKDRV